MNSGCAVFYLLVVERQGNVWRSQTSGICQEATRRSALTRPGKTIGGQVLILRGRHKMQLVRTAQIDEIGRLD
jgi:hypothetical protein